MIRKRVAAIEGLVAHFEFVARRNPGAAERLVDAVERTLKSLEAMPRLGRPWGRSGTALGQIRVRGVQDFENYLLYYRAIANGIEWLAIRHAAQDEPGSVGEE